ncbi:heparin lyase I family protein [Lutibacter sp.]
MGDYKALIMNKQMLLKKLAYVCLILFCIPSVSASENDLKEGSFKVSNLKSFDIGARKHRIVAENGGHFPKKSKKYVRYGQDSFLIAIPKKINGVEANSYIKNRSEIFIIRQASLEQDHWIQFSVFVPKNFIYPDNWFLFFQAWQIDAANPVVSFALDREGRMTINVTNDRYYSGKPLNLYRDEDPLGKGIWHDFVMNFKGGVNKNGKIFVWRRSGSKDSCFIKLIGKVGITIGKRFYPDGSFMKPFKRRIIPRVGIYRGKSSLSHQLWFDTLRYGKNTILNNLDAKCVE